MAPSEKNAARSGTPTLPGGRLGGFLVAVAVISLAADLLVDHHDASGIGGTFGFYAWFGALSCIVLAAAAWLVGLVLGRPDDYYDR